MAIEKAFRIPGELQVTSSANVGTTLAVGSSLEVSGNVTVTGTTILNGAINANNTLTATILNMTPVATSNAISVSNGNSRFVVAVNTANATLNPLTGNGDVLLAFSNGTINGGNLTIGSWTNRSGGFGLRFSPANYSITVTANTLVFGSTGIIANGAIGTAGQVLTSNGSSIYWGSTTAGVSSVATGNGVTGGTITSSGTISAVGANGISVTSSGINVQAGNSQVVSNTTGVWIDQSKIDLTSLSNYNANQHVDHTSISISAGNGLTGGGTIAANRTLAVTAGNSQVVANSSGVFIAQQNIDHNSLSNYNANQHVDHTSVTITAGNGLTGGGTIAANRTVSVLANTGLIANATGVYVLANNGIAANSSGLFVNANDGLVGNSSGLFVKASTGITVSGSGVAVNWASPGAIGSTSDNTGRFTSLGINTPASTSGTIRATGDITAFYSSDRRLKENIRPISDALGKLKFITGVMFDWTDEYIKSQGGEDGYFIRKQDTGVIAQDVQIVLPEVIAERPDGTLAVKYEKMMGLVIQAINELSEKFDRLEGKI